MAEVRPDEVSAILREQLSGYKSEAELEEVGTVLQVGDGVARIYGLSKAQAGELLEFENGLNALVLTLKKTMWEPYSWVIPVRSRKETASKERVGSVPYV